MLVNQKFLENAVFVMVGYLPDQGISEVVLVYLSLYVELLLKKWMLLIGKKGFELAVKQLNDS